MNEKFRNPYASLPKEKLSKMLVDVSTDDFNFIKCIRPPQHTISGTVGMLWQKLCTALKQKGITDVSKSNEFERFVQGCAITEGGGGRLYDGTVVGNLSESQSVGTGVTGVCEVHPGQQTVVSDVEGKRGKRQSKKGKGGETAKG